jgi:hypothetical protein
MSFFGPCQRTVDWEACVMTTHQHACEPAKCIDFAHAHLFVAKKMEHSDRCPLFWSRAPQYQPEQDG